jgi:hypothetical protein
MLFVHRANVFSGTPNTAGETHAPSIDSDLVTSTATEKSLRFKSKRVSRGNARPQLAPRANWLARCQISLDFRPWMTNYAGHGRSFFINECVVPFSAPLQCGFFLFHRFECPGVCVSFERRPAEPGSHLGRTSRIVAADF